MKIRTSLALKITGVTAVIFLALLLAVYFILKPRVDELWTILLPLFLLAIIILSVSAYFLSEGALRPIREIIDRMEKINATEIETRLPVERPTDEIGELSTAFNELLDRLGASFEAQKMFVSNVSHELRTPLAALIGELDLVLLKERTPERYKEALENALKDARRMSRLIDGLLNLAKADYQRGGINIEELRLDELLLDVRDFLLRGHPDYRIDLMFATESDADDRLITVRGNEYLLSIALSNLMDNNCKYSANKTSIVQISSWGENAILRFSDSGEGLSPEEMRKMFDPFYRGESKDRVEGYGIGMSLVRKIITLHGGTVRVFSRKHEGTTFLIDLPHI